MIGPENKVGDIELQLDELVMPANLLSDEVLSPNEDEEEVEFVPYRVDSSCSVCKALIRFHVTASDQGIRGLQQLLLSELSFVCLTCSRATCRRQNGRQ
ncbi:E7 [Human papillomavirus 191]|uniref:Protein E7 n=2 Tax=Papillomaviridae TaxID=151340 RepID=A0A2D2ALJ3_9PAPI|nr:E7 [Human papillomavirus 191]ATQ38332.1 E7 [Gammapapillomavirus 10]AYA93629.1 MAG: E7 protein [Human papillomavirus]